MTRPLPRSSWFGGNASFAKNLCGQVPHCREGEGLHFCGLPGALMEHAKGREQLR